MNVAAYWSKRKATCEVYVVQFSGSEDHFLDVSAHASQKPSVGSSYCSKRARHEVSHENELCHANMNPIEPKFGQDPL